MQSPISGYSQNIKESSISGQKTHKISSMNAIILQGELYSRMIHGSWFPSFLTLLLSNLVTKCRYECQCHNIRIIAICKPTELLQSMSFHTVMHSEHLELMQQSLLSFHFNFISNIKNPQQDQMMQSNLHQIQSRILEKIIKQKPRRSRSRIYHTGNEYEKVPN